MIKQDLITGVRFAGAASMIIITLIIALANRGKIRSSVYERSRWLTMKKYKQPAIKLVNIKTTILAGSDPNPTIGEGDHGVCESKRGIFEYAE